MRNTLLKSESTLIGVFSTNDSIIDVSILGDRVHFGSTTSISSILLIDDSTPPMSISSYGGSGASTKPNYSLL